MKPRLAGKWLLSVLHLMLFCVSTAYAESHIRRGFWGGYVHQWRDRPEILAERLSDLNASIVYLCPGNSPIQYVEGDAVCRFLDVLQKKGIGVSTYLIPNSVLFPAFKQLPSFQGSFAHCPIGVFSVEWEKVLSELAKYNYYGITVAPDEWWWSALNRYPECVEEFQRRYGKNTDPRSNTRLWTQMCYQLSRERVETWAKCVKSRNPKVEASVLFSMNPVLNGRRAESGVAWDELGYIKDLDLVCADPYVVLHGPPNHWYVPETVKHLVASSSRRYAEVVLQAIQHREYQRELTPVEVYGSALSAIWSGARSIVFFGTNQLLGEGGPKQNDLEAKYDRCKTTFKFIEQIESWLDGASSPKSIAVLHSRNSEDFYDGVLGAKTGYIAQKGMINFLLQNCYSFEIFCLEKVGYEDIKDFKVLVLPFSYYLPKETLKLVEQFAQGGGDVLVIGELGSVDENFKEYNEPPLANLLGIKSLGPPVFGNLSFVEGSPVLPGKEMEWKQKYGYVRIEPEEKTTVLSRVNGKPAGVTVCARNGGKCVYLGVLSPDFSGAGGAITGGILDYLLQGQKPVTVIKKPSDDIEVQVLGKGSEEKLILVINWMNAETGFQLQIPGLTGKELKCKYIVEHEGTPIKLGELPDETAGSDVLERKLAPYEANVLYIRGQM